MLKTVEEFISTIRADSDKWPVHQPRWFRGEPAKTVTPLLPRLYRTPHGASRENQLLQTFRARASAFSREPLPDRRMTDQWLFLAQHVGLPTRLLDWSEGALIGLYFALKEGEPVIWMLNPLHLNHLARGAPAGINPNDEREFDLPWFNPKLPRANCTNQNMRGAWEEDRPGVELPAAVHPSYVHPRLRAQHGCFTVHGKRKESLQALVPDSILNRYVIDPTCRESIRKELAVLGVTESVAYPDLDGLARDLEERFFT
jgi:hypothetical protein